MGDRLSTSHQTVLYQLELAAGEGLTLDQLEEILPWERKFIGALLVDLEADGRIFRTALRRARMTVWRMVGP